MTMSTEKQMVLVSCPVALWDTYCVSISPMVILGVMNADGSGYERLTDNDGNRGRRMEICVRSGDVIYAMDATFADSCR